MILLIAYLALALGVSFFCSIAEATLLSTRPAYIAALERRGRPGAKALKRLYDNLDRPLAAILTANTIAHTVGAAGVGAQSAIVFGSAYLGATSGVLTLLILVFSEIIPKSLGAAHWKTLAPTMGVLISWLSIALHPIVLVSEQLTRLVSPKDRGPDVSREEVQAMADLGAAEGSLHDRERRVIRNVMKLTNLSVRDIMPPRPVIFSAPRDMTVSDYFNAHADQPFSRIPLFAGAADAIEGYVVKADLFAALAADRHDERLDTHLRAFPAIPDSLSAADAFDRLLHEQSHIALIVDEYGTVQGLVTLEDVVETLIGLEITDEFDTVEDMQSLARRRWRERREALGFED